MQRATSREPNIKEDTDLRGKVLASHLVFIRLGRATLYIGGTEVDFKSQG